jgi:hypothetical protein
MSKPRTSMNGANKDKPPEAVQFSRPDEMTMCQTIAQFIYDPKKGAFFTRTPISWGLYSITDIIVNLPERKNSCSIGQELLDTNNVI